MQLVGRRWLIKESEKEIQKRWDVGRALEMCSDSLSPSSDVLAYLPVLFALGQGQSRSPPTCGS